MRAFLTGATGTVGREVCAALLERGVEVRVGARPSSKVTSLLPEVSDLVSLDFADPAISPSLFDGIDAFFFMTPLIDDQVAASSRVLRAAIEGGDDQMGPVMGQIMPQLRGRLDGKEANRLVREELEA